MTTNLDQYRKPARLRRRAPRRDSAGVVHVSITPKAGPQQVSTHGPITESATPASTLAIFPLRPHAGAPNGYSRSELATAAAMIQKLHRGDDVRMEKVYHARASLAADNYHEAMKMEIAVDRLLEDLANESPA